MRVYREWPLLILVYLLLSSAIFSSADDWPIPLLDSSNAWTCCNNSVPDKGADMLSGGCWDRTTDCLFASLIWQEIFYINNIYFARIISPELNSQLPPWLRRMDRERGGKGGGLGGKVVKVGGGGRGRGGGEGGGGGRWCGWSWAQEPFLLWLLSPNSYTTHSPFSGGSAALEPHFLLQHKPGRVKACFSSHAKLLCHHRKHLPYD